jgi:hypothetical protein
MYAPEMDFTDEIMARAALSRDFLEIIMEGSFFFNGIDSYVALSRDNTSVKSVDLYPFANCVGDFCEYWGKAGEIVGNLKELKAINIHFIPYPGAEDDEDYRRTPDWETLPLILQDVQHTFPRLIAEI